MRHFFNMFIIKELGINTLAEKCSVLLPAGACVGTAYTIEFDEQVGIVCLPGRGVIGIGSKSGHAPPDDKFCKDIC